MTVNRFTFTVAVPVPTGLTATAASSSQINLSWAAVSVATGYRVYRNGTLVGSPTAASYSDTGLSASTSYTYRVTALIGTAESAQSSPASATTQSSGGYVPLRTLYVNNLTGDDSWDGLAAERVGTTTRGPFATIGRAVRGSTNWAAPNASQAAIAGDLVSVAFTGTPYNEVGYRGGNASLNKSEVMLNPANSGTAANPITIRGVGGRPEIRAATALDRGGVIGSNNRQYIIWDNLFVDDTYSGSASDFGPVIFDYGANYCSLLNCEIRGHNGSYFWGHPTYTGNYRLVAGEYAYNITIRNNKISRARAGTSPGGQNEAGVLTYDCQNWTVEQNTFTDCGQAVFAKGSHSVLQTGWVVRRNIMAACGGGFRALDAVAPQCYQNIIRNGFGEQAIWIGWAAVPSAVIVNNTLASNFYGMWIQGDSPTNTQFHANIVASHNTALRFESVSTPTATGTYNRNCYFSNANFSDYAGTFATWQGAGQDAQSITSNPLFMNAATYDYRLQAGSPALTLGRDTYGLFGGSASTVIPAGAYVTGTEQIGADW